VPRVYQVTLIYVVYVHPGDDGAYPEGDDLGRELARGFQESADQTGDTKCLEPEQYELIEEEAD
jgi:hypothetical protein